ncbi:MAG: polyprenyl synthetase family protein [Calditrichaeota bacterium]|nr:MAG: polyprenyl synthetase family protein [Calditrichota bacterium]
MKEKKILQTTVELSDKFAHYKKRVHEYLSVKINPRRPFNLYDPIYYTMSGDGKRLRPALTMLTAEAFSGSIDDALPAAAAIELLHNFTLVHDDIMDRDDTRRGRATVHNKWDINVALLAGDGLVALAYETLLETPSDKILAMSKLFTQGLIEVCEGQGLDIEFETRDDVLADEYLDMIGKKTACLLSMCTQIGGLVSNASPADIALLKEFGWSLGIAFQIQDDLLDITADQNVLGKDFGSDIKQHKKTYILIHALGAGTPAQVHMIRDIYKKDYMRDEDILKVIDIFSEIGALKHTEDLAANYFSIAKKSLADLSSEADTTYLEQFLNLVLNRKA